MSDDRERAIAQLGGLTVKQVMITAPKTMPSDVTTTRVWEALEDDHVHMVLLVESGVLRGTITRADLKHARDSARPALEHSVLAGRTVGSSAAATDVFQRLRKTGERRLAVVDEEVRLMGLVCLKRGLHGFCSDRDVRQRTCAPSRLARPPSDLRVGSDDPVDQ